MKATVVLLALAVGAAGTPPAALWGQGEVEIKEWSVPWPDSRPRDPYVAGDGSVWFVGQRSDYVASLDPRTGRFERYDLEPGTGPHNLIVDEEGIVWYAGNRAAHIGRLDPGSREITKFPMPDPAARDPHTLVFDQQGAIWFTVQGGNFVGRLRPESGAVELASVPTPGARPYGIVTDAAGRPWIAEFGTHKLSTVDVTTLRTSEIELPRSAARPRRIGLTSDGKVWYVDYAEGYLGRFDPAAGGFEEWSAPSGRESRPYAMAVDAVDRIWFVETGPDPNRLVGFDPASQSFFSVTEIESGGGSVRHMVYDESRDEIWFGTDTNTIGRARLP